MEKDGSFMEGRGRGGIVGDEISATGATLGVEGKEASSGDTCPPSVTIV